MNLSEAGIAPGIAAVKQYNLVAVVENHISGLGGNLRITGGTSIGYIHSFVIEQGKNLLMNGHNIGETALLLGFDFPHHFTRLFKKTTGITPTEFLGK